MKIAIIDYKAGNAPSVLHAVNRLGHAAVMAQNPRDLDNATHIILPGVGSARATMDSLREMEILPALEYAVLRKKIFFLGICVGLQILFEHSEEENTECLGWLGGNVVKFAENVRVPQMGWNKVDFSKKTAIETRPGHFYFVNSYYAKPKNSGDIWATANYNGVFTAAVNKENIFATQFHVEKSGEAGLALLGGFLGGAPC